MHRLIRLRVRNSIKRLSFTVRSVHWNSTIRTQNINFSAFGTIGWLARFRTSFWPKTLGQAGIPSGELIFDCGSGTDGAGISFCSTELTTKPYEFC
jgi:hypothetical protein